MQTCKEWIQNNLKKFPDARKDILEFIYNITNHVPKDEAIDAIVNLFASGYCYYFALILKDAFGGSIYWIKYRSHIVWQDNETKICYDVWGVFDDYNNEDLIPIEILGDELETFRHRGKDFDKDIKTLQEQTQKAVNEYEKLQGWKLTSHSLK